MEDQSHCQSEVWNPLPSAAHLIRSFLLPHLSKMLSTGGNQKVQRQSTGHHREEQREHVRGNTAGWETAQFVKGLLCTSEYLCLIPRTHVKS